MVRNIVSRTLRVVRRARLPALARAHTSSADDDICNGVESFPWRGTPSSDLTSEFTLQLALKLCALGGPEPRVPGNVPPSRRHPMPPRSSNASIDLIAAHRSPFPLAYAAASISSKTSS